MELGTIYDEQVEWLSEVCEQPINPRSDALMDFFYEDLQLPVQRNYETGQPSLDADALEALARKEPIVRPLVERILRARSVGVVKSTFVDSRLDPDGRARSSYNASGTETMRWSSSKSVFGTGMNLQNVPKDATFGSVRSLSVPDKGQDIFDADLAGADAHVVAAIAAEYGDDSLLLEFNEGGDQHMKNARAIWGNSAGPTERQLAKTVVHATNYGASDTSVSMNTGLSKRDAARFQAIWFEAHPGIKRWHEDVWHQLQTTRTIYSKWGFRKVYFGRPESEFKEALAWVPQHTVAITTNLVADQLRKSGLPIQLLMQVHDSIVFQAPPSLKTSELEPFLIYPIPYTPILNIKMKVKRSHTSWGECQ
jgi:DNA polymerase-1